MLGDDLERWLGEVPTLREVLPIRAERRARGGGRLVLSSVEVWGDRLKWNVAQFPPPAPLQPGDPLPKFTMTDDAGTEYRLSAGGAGGDGRWWTEYVTFAPAPPPEATVVRLSGGALAHGVTVAVPLGIASATDSAA